MGRIDFEDLEDLEKLGDTIQDIIESAVRDKDFGRLNQTITDAMDKAQRGFDRSGRREGKPIRASERIKNDRAGQTGRSRTLQTEPARQLPRELYGSVTGERVKGILMATFGGILTGGMGIGFLTTLLLQLFVRVPVVAPSLILLAGTGAGAWLLSGGCRALGLAGRFQKYVNALGERTYCNFELLAQTVKKPVKFVQKDVKDMIGKGWFRQGHVDRQETCLITTDDTYRQYEQTQKQLEQRQEAARREQEARQKVSPEVQEVLDQGDRYLEKIRRSNDAIPGEEISAKISTMETIVEKIFDRAEAHPEVIPDLKRFMDYYLPMTVKLLDAYEEMDRQPVQGENIRSSKKEIEDTLDTLNDAFGRILDSIFQDTAWDVSSDISVLHTVLAQEGLAGNDFEMKEGEGYDRRS